MRKIYLGTIFFFISLLQGFGQTASTDSATFKNRKLKLEEVNFVSGYYSQDGYNSAVTGGIGSEKLTDLSSVLDVSLSRYDFRNRIHTLRLEAGIDHYTSASSDRIDPATVSSASAADNRFYPGVSWTRRDDDKRYAVGAGLSVSREYDYFSKGASLNFTRFAKDHNREFALSLGAYLDTWRIIYPSELRTLQTNAGPIPNPEASGTKPRNSYSVAISLVQVINQRMQVSLLLDPAYQSGQLATPFQRVYWQDQSVHVEHLPARRVKFPAGVRFNYFATDRVVLRSFYRFYADDWGLTAHTAELEVPYKITPFLSLSPFYRFYAQKAADYFAPYQQHGPEQAFYTSDYDLSQFTSHLAGLNLRFNSASGLLGINKLNTVEIRYGYYTRSTGLVSNSITLGLTLK